MKRLMLSVLFATVVALAGVAQAELANLSFESPVVEDYGPTLDNWTSNSSVEYSSGVLNATGWAGSADAAADGVQYAFVKNDNYIHQTVGTVEADQTYTLTVAAVQEYDLAADTPFSISLWDNDADVALATMSGVAGAVGDGFLDYSTSFNTLSGNNASAVGHSMSVVLSNDLASSANVADNNQMYFDNVRLAVTAVPEPATLALLATGLPGLLCCAWRKRK